MLNTLIILFMYSVKTSIIVGVMVFLCKLFLIKDTKHTHKLQLGDILVMVLLIGVSSIRYGVGSDYYKYMKYALSYAKYFRHIGQLLNFKTIQAYSYQIGYPLVSVLTYRVLHHPTSVFFVVACILYIPYIIYFRKKTANVFWATAVYLLFGFWGLSLNILKQAISMVFILYAYESYKDKQYVKFGILSAISFLFHTTGILAVFGILATRFIKPTKKHLYTLVLAGFGLKLVFMFIVAVLIRIPFFSKYYNRYFVDGSVAGTDRTLLLVGAFFETILVIGFVNYAIKNRNKLLLVQGDIDSYITILMVGIPFSILGVSRTLWLSNRFAKFFFQFLLVLIPAMFGNKRLKVFDKEVIGEKVMSSSVRNFIIIILFVWHFMYSVLMLDNNALELNTIFNM